MSILEPIQLENQIFFCLVFSDKCVVLCVCLSVYVNEETLFSVYISPDTRML